MDYTIDDLLAKADAIPSKEDRMMQLLPVLKKLREEKKLSWGEISSFMSKETGHIMSQQQWAQSFYKWKQADKLRKDQEAFDAEQAKRAGALAHPETPRIRPTPDNF